MDLFDTFLRPITTRLLRILREHNMKTVIAHLNAVIEDRMPIGLKPQAAADALAVIEYGELAVGGLRLVLLHERGDKQALAESFRHIERIVEQWDKETVSRAARYAPKPLPLTDFVGGTDCGGVCRQVGGCTNPAECASWKACAHPTPDDASDLV